MIFKLYLNSDNLIRWDKLVNAASGKFVNDATMTFTLKDADGDTVSGAVDVVMGYVGNSDGRYQGVMDSTISLSIGTKYYLEITAVSGTLNGFRRIECMTHYRGAN